MKKILKFLVMIMMVVALTGCMKINMNVEVQEDLTAKMSMELLMDESFLSMSGEDPDKTLKQMQEQMISEDELKDVKVETIEKTIDGSKWKGLSIEGIANNESKSSAVVKKETVDGKEKITLTLPMEEMSEEMDPESLASSGYSVEQMKKLGIEMNVTIKMPGKATCNVGTVDGDTVTIDLLEMMASGNSQDIVVTSDISSGGFDMTMILVVVAIVVIGGVVIFMKKKKKTTEEVVETPVSEPVMEEFVEPVNEETVTEVVEEEPKEVEETISEDATTEEPVVEEVVEPANEETVTEVVEEEPKENNE